APNSAGATPCLWKQASTTSFAGPNGSVTIWQNCQRNINTSPDGQALRFGARDWERTMNVAVRNAATQADAGALKLRAAQLRGKVIEMSHAAQAAHLASSLSCADVVTAAYWHVLNIDPREPKHPLRDRFILSKGHAAAALYAALATRGFFPIEELDTYCKDGGRLCETPAA